MPTAAAISLAAPWMLLGLAVLAAPILAHLTPRRAARAALAPTLALLARAAAPQIRRRAWHDRLLLALRCAAMACLVLAFAQPLWHRGPGSAPASSPNAAATPLPQSMGQDASVQPLAVVIILDTSASTAQRDASASTSAFDLLRSHARAVLLGLRLGLDRAALVTTTEPGHGLASTGGSSASLADPLAVNQDLDALSPRPLPSRPTAAFARAATLLGGHPGPRRLILLTDLQSTDWASASLPSELAGVDVVIIPPNPDPRSNSSPAPSPANLALEAPRVRPARPLAGEPADLLVTLRHFARGADVGPVEIRAAIDGRPLPPQRVTPLPQGVLVRFPLPPLSTGLHEAVVTIANGDALEIDNAAHLVVHVRPARVVLLLCDQDPDRPASPAFFLARALSPQPAGEGRVDLRTRRPADLKPSDLADAPTVVIAPGTWLDAQAAGLVAQARAEGSGVALFAGGDPDDPALRRLLGLGSTAPAIAIPAAGPRPPARLSADSAPSPLLLGFDAPARAALAQIDFSPLWSVAAPIAAASPSPPGPRVELAFADGSPAVLAFDPAPPSALAAATRATSPAPSSPAPILLLNLGRLDTADPLVRQGLFPAIIQNLLARLDRPTDPAHAPSPVSADPVEPLLLHAPGLPDAPPTLTLVPPQGPPRAVEPLWTGGRWEVRFIPEHLGFHRLFAGPRRLDAAAAAFPASESDLSPMAPDALASRLAGNAPGSPGKTPGSAVAPTPRVASALDASLPPPSPLPLWPALAAAAILLLGCEALVLAGRRR